MKNDQTKRKIPGKKEVKKQATQAEQVSDCRQPPDPVLVGRFHQETKPAYEASKTAYPFRLDSSEAWARWEATVIHQFGVYKKYARLLFPNGPVSEEEVRYGWDFQRDMELMKGGDKSKVEVAIAFLEDDPWFHGSGYDKAKLIRYIKPTMLTPAYRERLQQVVLALVDKRDDRDFRAFCKLAHKVDAPDLREQLMRRMNGGDADTSRRARWVLEALAQKDSMEKRL